MLEMKLPFFVGQEVEAKTFEEGYRGAWFRSKILKISLKEGELLYDLEYFDFPGEAITPTGAYQFPRHDGSVSGRKKHLMVRPKFPASYRKSEMPNMSMISEEAVIFYDDWRVGDVVDWWTNTSFWTGTVTGIKENGKVKIMLIPPPVGEGGEKYALSKHLRPSLNWSLENGWRVRSPRCAKLIKPPTNRPQPSCSNYDGSLEADSLPLGKHKQEDDSSDRKKITIDSQLLPNSMSGDTLEAAVSDLVVLSCQMRRMKGIIKMGASSPRSSVPSWKFVEHRAPPM